MPNENINRRPHMGRGPGMRGPGEKKAKDFKSAIKRLFKELKSFRILIFIALVLASLGSVMSIVAPNRLSNLTDEISKGLFGTMDMNAITKIAMFLAILYIASAVFTFIESILMTEIANRFNILYG